MEKLNYYESVVVDYLRADRSLFVNTEYCIQLKEGNPDLGGPHSHWYCDAVIADFRSQSVFLCEISYSASLQTLIGRLKDWNENWLGVQEALIRDSKLPVDWEVRPWLFVPEKLVGLLQKGLEKIRGDGQLSFRPLITNLEMVQPWEYKSWNRHEEKTKPGCILPEMRT